MEVEKDRVIVSSPVRIKTVRTKFRLKRETSWKAMFNNASKNWQKEKR